jgi:hypothetical protein
MPGGRPRKTPTESTPVYIRLPDAVVDGYERWRDELRATVVGGGSITIQDVMRSVLEKGLAAHQAEATPPAKARRPTTPRRRT